MNEDTFTFKQLKQVNDYISIQTEPSSKRQISTALNTTFENVDYLVERLIMEGKVKSVGYGLFELMDYSDCTQSISSNDKTTVLYNKKLLLKAITVVLENNQDNIFIVNNLYNCAIKLFTDNFVDDGNPTAYNISTRICRQAIKDLNNGGTFNYVGHEISYKTSEGVL